jgi:hypothetical protein
VTLVVPLLALFGAFALGYVVLSFVFDAFGD